MEIQFVNKFQENVVKWLNVQIIFKKYVYKIDVACNIQ